MWIGLPIPEIQLSKVKAMHVVKGQGRIVGSATNRITSFSFHINQPYIPKIQVLKKLTLKIQHKVMAKVKIDVFKSIC